MFLRGADGIVGIGEALRLTFSGPHRIADAAAAWRPPGATAAESSTRWACPGTGLVAFGSFAFADDSAVESCSSCRRVIIGRRDGVALDDARRDASRDRPRRRPRPLAARPPVERRPRTAAPMTPARYHDAVAGRA